MGLVGSMVVVGLLAACGDGEETTVPTVTPTFTPASAPADTAIPAPTQPPAAQPTQAPASGGDSALVAQGKAALERSLCIGCHKIEGTAAVGTIGPELTHIGTVAATRVAGQSAEAYIRESIENPTAFVAEGFNPLMPPGLQAVLGDDYDAVVAYLMSLE
jgi:cytochrome c1